MSHLKRPSSVPGRNRKLGGPADDFELQARLAGILGKTSEVLQTRSRKFPP